MLDDKNSHLVNTPIQQELFHIEKQIEIDGIELGVLDNGIPYLTERGLASMCGVSNVALHNLAEDWETEQTKPRGKQID